MFAYFNWHCLHCFNCSGHLSCRSAWPQKCTLQLKWNDEPREREKKRKMTTCTHLTAPLLQSPYRVTSLSLSPSLQTAGRNLLLLQFSSALENGAPFTSEMPAREKKERKSDAETTREQVKKNSLQTRSCQGKLPRWLASCSPLVSFSCHQFVLAYTCFSLSWRD